MFSAKIRFVCVSGGLCARRSASAAGCLSCGMLPGYADVSGCASRVCFETLGSI